MCVDAGDPFPAVGAWWWASGYWTSMCVDAGDPFPAVGAPSAVQPVPTGVIERWLRIHASHLAPSARPGGSLPGMHIGYVS
jgi:hypothetical protein